jgi:hypothetical protein
MGLIINIFYARMLTESNRKPMSIALETAIEGFTPTKLQQAAIERIQYFQEELKHYGVYMRSSMELEFMVEDSQGRLTPYTINLKEAEKHLKSAYPRLPHLESLKTDASSEYEITIADHFPKGMPVNPEHFNPVAIAEETATLKQNALSDMLQQSSCLNQQVNRSGVPPYSPVFHAYPYSRANNDSSWQYEDRSSALHINVSLYDKDGKNLFSESPILLEECARSLVNVQQEAALAFLPKNNSLKRLRPEAHLSVPGGIGMEPSADFGKRRHSTVNTRGGMIEVGGTDAKEKYQHETRIENRLPGADADPFVALAVTMAAMLDAVQYELPEKHTDPQPKHHFPESKKEMLQALKSSSHMRELLGNALYTSIMDEYGKTAERRR